MVYSICFADNKEFWESDGKYYLIKPYDTAEKNSKL